MKKSFFFTLVLTIFLAIIISLSSCIVAVVDYSESGTVFPKKEFHKSVSFKPGGTISLDNSNGDIEISGWEQNEVELFANEVKSIPYQRKVRIYGVSYSEPKIDFEKLDEDFIKIKTRSSGRDRENSVFNCLLNVPHSINLEDIRNRRGNISISDLYGKAVLGLKEGDLRVENFSGSLEASVGIGSVQAELLDLRNEDEIKIMTTQGDITLYLQPEVNAQVEASASSGEISSEFDLKQALPSKKITAQIGQGGASLSISTLNGNIKIEKIKETGRGQ